MRQLPFKQVDVFTRKPFGGNPAAVVLGADALDGAQMQRIANWTNLSETTFVLQPSSAQADYRLRIFTPRAELPFAGHPTIGSAHAVLEAGIVKPKNGAFRQECGAGVLELSVEQGGRIWVKAPPQNAYELPADRLRDLEKALGAAAVGTPQVVNVGPVWLVADLGGAGNVDALAPSMQGICLLSDELGITGITVFGKASGDAAIHVRSFAPAHGVPEDPVCGSGNVSVAAYLSTTGKLERYGTRYQARQGMALGRDGRVSIRVEEGVVFLGGEAVTCVEGELRVSPVTTTS